jgi:hypothetical protein
MTMIKGIVSNVNVMASVFAISEPTVGLQVHWSRREATGAILMALTAAPRFSQSATEQTMTTRSAPVIRVSILRCQPERFLEFERMMSEAAKVLLPGIQAMRGCRGYFAGSDQTTSSLSNVSIWETLEDAKQMERFQPMLDMGKRFLDAGATFERPIMNYGTLWQLANAEEAKRA